MCPSMLEPFKEETQEIEGLYRPCSYFHISEGFETSCPCSNCSSRRGMQGWKLRSSEKLYGREPLVLINAQCLCHGTLRVESDILSSEQLS